MSKKKNQKEEFKQEDVLQAVVIAENFANTFATLNNSTASALVPLANLPLLSYVLEFLSSVGVQEIIVVCKNHSENIKEYLRTSTVVSNSCEIIPMVSDSCSSFGDALREIDAKGLIRSDFVLVNSDVIANIPIKHIIEQHKERRKRDKTPVMTFLLSDVPPGHASRHREDELVLATNAITEKLLYYKKAANVQKFNIPLSTLLEHNELQLHYNLLDPQIGICSPQVPMLFTENFDWQTWDNFVKGILDNEEILGNTIHGHVIEKGYALQANSLLAYDSISKDIMHRWTYPLVPDHSDYKYDYKQHNVYQHQDAKIDRSATLREDVVVGENTKIGADTTIIESVIGNNCVIGSNVRLENVYLWNDVHIDNNCTIKRSMIANSVHVGNECCLQNAVISEKININEHSTLPDGIVIVSSDTAINVTSTNWPTCEDAGITSVQYPGGTAHVYCPQAAGSFDDVDGLCDALWSVDIQSEVESESSEESEFDDNTSLPDNMLGEEEDDQMLFLDEVIGTLERALEEGISVDNLVLEVNSLKHAYNIQIKEVNDLVTKALLQLPFRKHGDINKTQYLVEIKKVLKTFLPLLKNYIKSEASQMDCLCALQSESLDTPVICNVVSQLLHVLYQVDVIPEETAIAWYNKMDSEIYAAVKSQVHPFITWLEEAEEESDED